LRIPSRMRLIISTLILVICKATSCGNELNAEALLAVLGCLPTYLPCSYRNSHQVSAGARQTAQQIPGL
jgi:hypothetical protein